MTIGALGVVFGDIWTSPLYTIQTIFSTDGSQPIALTRASVYGLISMVVWSVTIIVTLKCVLLVMRADNDGKGGFLALIIPISRGPHRGGRRTALVLIASQAVIIGTFSIAHQAVQLATYCDCGSNTPQHAPTGISTSRSSTGSCSSQCWPSCSRSAAQPRSPLPLAWP